MSSAAPQIHVPTVQVETQPPADEPLFRAEVITERQTQWLGAVLLAPRLSSTLFVAAGTIAALALIALLFFGSFTRKARINGWLVPEQGVARIFAPQAGVVTQIHAREGMIVTKGMPLITLSSEVQSELGATKEEVVRRLVERRDSLVTALDIQKRLFDQQAADLNQRLALLASERRFLSTELELVRRQTQISESDLTRARMTAADFNNPSKLLAPQRNHFELDAKLQTLERSRAAHQRGIVELQSTLRTLPLRRRSQLAEIERSLAALEQELAEAEARRQIVVVAPSEGTVTGIQTEPGGNANPTIPLMSIVPSSVVLQAHLFGPSRAIGFVRPGQRVLMRYQAFPYQKFGLYEGVIKNVSRSAVSPSELTQQLAGLTSLYAATEPVYRITVELAHQTARAYGEAVPLQPGMQLEADVVIETRSLIEWVLDPLFSLTGKLQ